MTVLQLIEELSKCDFNREVLVTIKTDGATIDGDIESVRRVVCGNVERYIELVCSDF